MGYATAINKAVLGIYSQTYKDVCICCLVGKERQITKQYLLTV